MFAPEAVKLKAWAAAKGVTARAAGQDARAAARKITVFSAAGVVLGKLGEVDPVSLTFEELSGLIFHEAVVEYADRAEKVWAVTFWDSDEQAWSELVNEKQFSELKKALASSPAEVRRGSAQLSFPPLRADNPGAVVPP